MPNLCKHLVRLLSKFLHLISCNRWRSLVLHVPQDSALIMLLEDGASVEKIINSVYNVIEFLFLKAYGQTFRLKVCYTKQKSRLCRCRMSFQRISQILAYGVCVVPVWTKKTMLLKRVAGHLINMVIIVPYWGPTVGKSCDNNNFL